MRQLITITLLLLITLPVYTQQYDLNWTFGSYQDFSNNYEIDNIQFDFHQQPVEIFGVDTVDMIFYYQRTAISDSTGKLIFYSNGCEIKDSNFEIMPNGDTLNPGYFYDSYCDPETGWNTYPAGPQTMVAVPQPGHSNIWYLFHKDIHFFENRVGNRYNYYTKINTSLRDGLGDVVEENVLLDSIPGGHGFGVVKSANLDAWYITAPRFLTNEFYIYRLDSSGIELHHQQNIGEPTELSRDGGKFNRFSPDGQYFATYDPLSGLELFDFDRTQGVLSNPRFIPSSLTIDSAFIGSVEFSPNGRFLYTSSYHYIDQYDLEAEDLAASRIRVGVLDFDPDEFFNPAFAQLQLGPDCRLYVFCTSCEYVHIIHRPDELGAGCMLEQKAIQTPFPYFRGAPLYPKYRMKALGDTSSICDHVTASIFSSTRDILTEAETGVEVLLYPNPTQGDIRLVFGGNIHDLSYRLFDVLGREVLSGKSDYLPAGNALRLDTRQLPSGRYFLQLREGKTGQYWSEAVEKL